MSSSRVAIHIVLVITYLITSTAAQCTSGECFCDTSSGRIDLRPILRTGSYSYSVTSGDFTYYYNLCGAAVSYGGCDENSAVCQVSNVNEDQQYNTGSINDEEIVIEGDDVKIQYIGGTDGRQSIIQLICDESATEPQFSFIGEFTSLQYEFELRTECACYDVCGDGGGSTSPPNTDPSDGGSSNIAGAIGIVLITLAIVVILVYFIVGGILLHVKFEKRGTDVIPQRAFWFDLPFLVKDGFVFTFSPIYFFIKSKMGRGNYESVK